MSDALHVFVTTQTFLTRSGSEFVHLLARTPHPLFVCILLSPVCRGFFQALHTSICERLELLPHQLRVYCGETSLHETTLDFQLRMLLHICAQTIEQRNNNPVVFLHANDRSVNVFTEGAVARTVPTRLCITGSPSIYLTLVGVPGTQAATYKALVDLASCTTHTECFIWTMEHAPVPYCYLQQRRPVTKCGVPLTIVCCNWSPAHGRENLHHSYTHRNNVFLSFVPTTSAGSTRATLMTDKVTKAHNGRLRNQRAQCRHFIKQHKVKVLGDSRCLTPAQMALLVWHDLGARLV
jgi:hypothetical protein